MKPGWAWLVISAASVWAQVPATTDAASPDRASLPGWGRRIVELLEIQPGSTVADVGAGRGTFLPIWSVAVGSTGRIIAEDIDNTSMDHARELGKQHNWSNIEFVLGTPRDAMLPERTIRVRTKSDYSSSQSDTCLLNFNSLYDPLGLSPRKVTADYR